MNGNDGITVGVVDCEGSPSVGLDRDGFPRTSAGQEVARNDVAVDAGGKSSGQPFIHPVALVVDGDESGAGGFGAATESDHVAAVCPPLYQATESGGIPEGDHVGDLSARKVDQLLGYLID